MKKLGIILISILFIFTLVACGGKKCEHTYSGDCDEDCNACGEASETTAVHTYSGDCDEDCNECGEIRETSIEHYYYGDCDGGCHRCFENRKDVAEHSWSPATCTLPEGCDECGACIGEPLGHEWTTPDVVLCEVQSTCSRCGATDGENKEHTPNDDDGDCTTAITCSVCEAVTTEAKKTHTPNADDGDCTTAITCSVCETVTTEAKENHTLEKWVDNGDGTHSPACQYCYYVDITSTENHLLYVDENCKCEKCGMEHYLYFIDEGNCMCMYCAEYIHNLDENCVCAVCSLSTHIVNSTTGICSVCNTFVAAASITVDGTKTYYSTFEEVIAYANGKDGIVIVIENDCCVRDPFIKFDSGNITLDLNGKTLDSVIGYSVPVNGATVTIRDSVGGGKASETVGGWSGTIIIENGTYSRVASPGNLIITGGEFTYVTVTIGETATISGGSFETIGVYNEVGTLADILAYGYCFYDKDGNVVDISNIELDNGWYYLYNVTVGEIK